MPDIDIGNHEIDEDSNGDLVIKDPNDNIIFRVDSSLSTIEILDKLGANLDLNSNQLLNAVLGTALNANSQNINNVGALDTQQVNNTVFASTNDDLVTKVSNLSSGGEIVILPGTHTISQHLAPPDNTTLTVIGTVELADSAQDRILERTNGATGITIRGPGEFVGNRDTVSYTGNKIDHVGLNFENSPSNITIRDITVRNVLGGAAVRTEAEQTNYNPGDDIHIENITVRTCGNGTVRCDGIFMAGDDSTIRDCVVEDFTDTGIVAENSRGVTIADNNINVTSSYVTNNQAPAAGITTWSQNRTSEADVTGNKITNLGSGAFAFWNDSDTGNECRMDVIANHVEGTFENGVVLFGNADESTVADNRFEGPAANGVDMRAPGTVADNVVKSAGGNGYVIRASGVVVEGNRSDTATVDGISLTSGVTDCLFNSNVLRNGTNGIDRSASNTASNAYVGNVLTGNSNAAIDGTLGTGSQDAGNVTS